MALQRKYQGLSSLGPLEILRKAALRPLLSCRNGQSSPNAAAAGKAIIHQTHDMPNNKSTNRTRFVSHGFNVNSAPSLHKLDTLLQHGRIPIRPRTLVSAESGREQKRRHCAIEEQKVCPLGVDSEEMLRAMRCTATQPGPRHSEVRARCDCFARSAYVPESWRHLAKAFKPHHQLKN